MFGFQQPKGKWQLAFLATANSLSMAHFGYDQAIFAGALISSDFLEAFPETKNPNISGITSSCFSVGAFFGCVAAFILGDRLGRKNSVWAGLAFNVTGAVLQIAAFNLPQLIVGRLVNGFGMGVISSTCPVYVAECSPSRLRGKLVVLGSLCVTVGVCVASWINFALFNKIGPFQWRFPLALQLIFPVLVILLLPLAVESPRWLILRGKLEAARLSLARLRGIEHNLADKDLNDDLKSIQKSLQEEREAQVPITDVFLLRDSTQDFRRLILSCGTQLMQQFTGVNALGYYLPTLLIQSVGVSNTQARLLTATNSVVYLAAAFCCLIIVDLVGRRKLMIYGSVTTGICYLIAAVTLKVADNHPERKSTLSIVTVSMFFLYYFCYGTSFAKVPWVYNSEINSLGWRARGSAAATATNWLGGFVTVQFTKAGVDNLGWGFYLLFSCFCWSYLPIIYLFYPETSRRTLEDMDEIFRRHKGLFVFRNHILTQRRRPQFLLEAEQRRIEEATASAAVSSS